MRVAIVQHDIRWGQPAENLQRLSQILDQQQGADLYVLSETFTTGFLAKETKHQDSEESLRWLQQQARDKDAAFAASIAATDADGGLRNRLYFVRPDGTFSYYDIPTPAAPTTPTPRPLTASKRRSRSTNPMPRNTMQS